MTMPRGCDVPPLTKEEDGGVSYETLISTARAASQSVGIARRVLRSTNRWLEALQSVE